MNERSKHRFANLPEGGQEPLTYAVTQRDESTLAMVKDSIAHKRTLLAYQPVMRDITDENIGF